MLAHGTGIYTGLGCSGALNPTLVVVMLLYSYAELQGLLLRYTVDWNGGRWIPSPRFLPPFI
jgi:hypothetical protein